MAKLPSREEMQARFWELKPKRDAQQAKAAPLREARDKLAAKHRKEDEAAIAKIRAAEKGLAEIEQEMAMLVRAVGGAMGDPEAQQAAE